MTKWSSSEHGELPKGFSEDAWVVKSCASNQKVIYLKTLHDSDSTPWQAFNLETRQVFGRIRLGDLVLEQSVNTASRCRQGWSIASDLESAWAAPSAMPRGFRQGLSIASDLESLWRCPSEITPAQSDNAAAELLKLVKIPEVPRLQQALSVDSDLESLWRCPSEITPAHLAVGELVKRESLCSDEYSMVTLESELSDDHSMVTIESESSISSMESEDNQSVQGVNQNLLSVNSSDADDASDLTMVTLNSRVSLTSELKKAIPQLEAMEKVSKMLSQWAREPQPLVTMSARRVKTWQHTLRMKNRA